MPVSFKLSEFIFNGEIGFSSEQRVRLLTRAVITGVLQETRSPEGSLSHTVTLNWVSPGKNSGPVPDPNTSVYIVTSLYLNTLPIGSLILEQENMSFSA